MMVNNQVRGDSVKRVLTLSLALLLIAGCSGGRASRPASSQPTTPPAQTEPAKPDSPPAKPAEPEKPPEPGLTDRPLYLLAPPAKPVWDGPFTVIVENSPGSRPQTGLEKADLVVELLAESEVTRFVTLWWSAPAAKIGPVRSARSGFIAMAGAYGTPLVHSGGSAEAIATLQSEWGDRDLDEIYGAGAYFKRSADRDPPHNLYTSTDLLTAAISDRKLEMSPVPTTERSDSAPPAKPVAQVKVNWHRLHSVRWDWKDDHYLRFEHEGEPHSLEGTGQIQAKNLVFLRITGENRGYYLGWTLDFAPGGHATVISGGRLWEGTWSLGDGGFVITPNTGEKVPLLAPGTTWVHLITQESDFELVQP